jgi:hypothetical protein
MIRHRQSKAKSPALACGENRAPEKPAHPSRAGHPSESQRLPSAQEPNFVQSSDEVANKVRRLIEKWNDRLTFDNLRLSERYLKGEIHILICFRYGDSGEFVATIQREFSERLSVKEARQFSGGVFIFNPETVFISRDCFWRHTMGRITKSDCKQKMMLVDNVEAVDMPQNCATSSLVWFENLNSFDRVWPKSLYYSRRLGFIFRGSLQLCSKISEVASNGKVQFSEGMAMPLRANPGQTIYEMVKSAPQTMNSVAGDEGRPIGNGECGGKIPNALSRLKVILTANDIGFFNESKRSFLEVTNVFFGPFDLCM